MKIKLLFILLFPLQVFAQSEYGYIYPSDVSITPLNLSKNDFAFRLYANNGKSVNRIYTITLDTLEPVFDGMYDGIEKPVSIIGKLMLYGKVGIGKKSKNYYDEIGFEEERTLEILNILMVQNWKDFENRIDDIPLPLHSNASIYTIEILNSGAYYTFKFITQYPNEKTLDTKYEELEVVFFNLFPELTEIVN
jgi:hypothetical protein